MGWGHQHRGHRGQGCGSVIEHLLYVWGPGSMHGIAKGKTRENGIRHSVIWVARDDSRWTEDINFAPALALGPHLVLLRGSCCAWNQVVPSAPPGVAQTQTKQEWQSRRDHAGLKHLQMAEPLGPLVPTTRTHF